MTAPENIRRHTNGSIDRQHYMQIGRQCRSEAFYEGVRMVARSCAALSAGMRRVRLQTGLRRQRGVVAQI